MRDGWIETNIGSVFHIQQGKTLAINKLTDGKYPVYGANGIVGRFNEFNFDFPVTGLGCRGSCGTIYYIQGKAFLANNVMAIWEKDSSKIESRFIPLALSNVDLVTSGAISGQVQPQITKQGLEPVAIKIPPLPEQKRIVDLIASVDSYIEALQQELDSAKRSRNAALRELLTTGGEDWVQTTIGDISSFISTRKTPDQLSANSIYVGLEHLEPNTTSINDFDSTSKVSSSLTPFDVGDVLFGRLRPYLHKVALAGIKGYCSPEILVLRANSNVIPQMLLLYCDADSTIKTCVERSAGTRMPRTNTADLASIEVNLPPMPQQELLADLFGAFDATLARVTMSLDKAKLLRSGMLSDLLSGTHEIPASYDKVIGAA
jgi:type I restriction enzyme S subunit